MKDEFVDRIGYYCSFAKGIAWDTCHKIYILLDDEQMDLMREYEYDPLISSADMDADSMTAAVVRWYEESCGLRFVSAVFTNKDNPNAGFENVIEQFEDDDPCANCEAYESYEDDLCYDCWEDENTSDEDE